MLNCFWLLLALAQANLFGYLPFPQYRPRRFFNGPQVSCDSLLLLCSAADLAACDRWRSCSSPRLAGLYNMGIPPDLFTHPQPPNAGGANE